MNLFYKNRFTKIKEFNNLKKKESWKLMKNTHEYRNYERKKKRNEVVVVG